jgi:uncharacterized membrane protein YeaQ/YmgE (transglycosylase-associated protein family)
MHAALSSRAAMRLGRRWGVPRCPEGIGIMEGQSLLVFLLVGLIAGWLAGKIMRGSGFGIIGDLIVGIIGAFIGGWLWGALHLPTIGNFWINAIVTATVGALVLLFLLRLIRR